MTLRTTKTLVSVVLVLLAGVAVAAKPVKTGSLYIPNWQGSSATGGNVLEFDASSGQLKRQLIGSLGIDIISGMTVGPDRNLYLSVLDTVNNQNGRLLVYSLDGAFIRTAVSSGAGGLEFPNGVRFGPDGNLYVASNSPAVDKVLRFSPKNGRYLGLVGSNLITPQDMTFGPDGLLYVTNGNSAASSVYQFDPVDDVFLGAFVPTGTGGLQNPVGLAFGPDRNLYIVSFPLNAVLRYDGTSGTFLGVFASLDGLALDTPTDLVFGPDGNLYVYARSATTPYSAVVRFDGTSGAFIDVFVGVGSGGLGVGNTGMLFVDPGCARYGDNGFGNRCFTGGRARAR